MEPVTRRRSHEQTGPGRTRPGVDRHQRDRQPRQDGTGYTITKIALTTRAKVPGIDAASFATIAEETKRACPVSKALAGTTITFDAALA